MRKLRVIKVVVPEIVAYFGQGSKPKGKRTSCKKGY